MKDVERAMGPARFKALPLLMGDSAPTAATHEMNRLAAGVLERRSAEIDRRILAGENRIQVGKTVYTVQSWREAPIKRLRIEWARFRSRTRPTTR